MFADLLEEALDAWTEAREGVIEEVANIPADRFDFRPKPEVRSVAEMVRHILEVSLMMVGELTREDTDFRRLPWPRLLATYAGDVQQLGVKEELLAALRETLAQGRTRFQTVGELHMLQLIERFDGELGTRLAWLHHGIAQEMYHRAQLTTYARLMDLEPALTRKIRGA
jgi:uncharacterized damage-inducible protein DinB